MQRPPRYTRRLSHPRPVSLPGGPVDQAALGYLHANCGNCHNETAGIRFLTPFSLRLSVHDQRIEDTAAFRTAVGVPVEKFVYPGVTHRIAPGNPAASCVYVRMGLRTPGQQMPPVGTEVPDPAGLDAVATWIAGFAP